MNASNVAKVPLTTPNKPSERSKVEETLEANHVPLQRMLKVAQLDAASKTDVNLSLVIAMTLLTVGAGTAALMWGMNQRASSCRILRY